MAVRCCVFAIIFVVFGCDDGGLGGRTWRRVEGPVEPVTSSSNVYTNKNNTQLDTSTLGSIPVVSYSFDANSRMGKLSVDITGKGIEVRGWIVENIGKICSSHNITLEAGKEPVQGGRYMITKESVNEGILTIEFEALY